MSFLWDTGPATVEFNYTGSVQTFDVPVGVTELTLRLYGAGFTWAAGGYVEGTISVSPGDTLYIYVGESPSASTGGWPGGGDGGDISNVEEPSIHAIAFGGCGYTSVRLNGDTTGDMIALAGGAGGKGDADGGDESVGSGGQGGADTGGDGANAFTDDFIPQGGGGGTQSSGGSGGGDEATSGGLRAGGSGDEDESGDDTAAAGGGGGAGMYGGGGGESVVDSGTFAESAGAGGGAGSNNDDGLDSVTANERGTGTNNHGRVEIEYRR